VEGGYVNAFDHLREEVRTFALHRITGVRPVDEDAPLVVTCITRCSVVLCASTPGDRR
jgi:predicted DNA-binding transcriptional regulator YafY